MVVIVIIAMAAALVVPRLPAPEGAKLKSSARNLASAIRFLNDRAIVTKGVYRLHLNITDSSVSIARISEKGEELPPDDQFLNRRFIEEGIAIEDVTAPRVGKVSEGEAIIAFGPGGTPEPLIVHLKGAKKEFTIIAYPFGGKIEVQEGYRELQPEVGT